MFHVTKAQYQQLVQNTKDGGLLSCPSRWVVPYGLDQGPFASEGIFLVSIDKDRPYSVLYVNRYIDCIGTEHEDLSEKIGHDKIKIIRSKFLHDLKLAYEFWQYCRWRFPYKR